MSKGTDQVSDDPIALAEAVELIADIVYPQEEPRCAKKRVRQRIDDAVRHQRLRKIRQAGRIFLARQEFEQWAADTWPKVGRKLGKVAVRLKAKTARKPFKRVIILSAPPEFDPSTIEVPSDVDELKNAYIRLHEELYITKYREVESARMLDEALNREAKNRRSSSESGELGRGVSRPGRKK